MSAIPQKREWKELVASNRFKALFEDIRQKVRNGDAYNRLAALENRYLDHKKKQSNGDLISNEDTSEQKRLTSELLRFIEAVKDEDLVVRGNVSGSISHALPSYYAFACDRFEQRDSFELACYNNPDAKVYWFFLYGDARQAHAGLFERLGRDLGGYLENWEKGDFSPGINLKFCNIKPEVSRNSTLYQLNIIKALFVRFFPNLDGKTLLQNMSLNDLLLQPSDIAGYGPNDMVFVLLTLDAFNWNKDLIPRVLNSFIQNFLTVDLPANAPRFYFFFGVEYKKDDTRIKQEVKEVIDNREFGGEALDSLEPVKMDDVEEWFSRYRSIMVPPNKTYYDMRLEHFPAVDHMDMLDIQLKLLELIEKRNKGLLL